MNKPVFAFLNFILLVFLASCGGSDIEKNKDSVKTEIVERAPGDPKGIGDIRNVKLTDRLDKEMIKKGESVYNMKCSACHKLNTQRVVGPGWEGITNKRSPEWIMNMATNVDVMLDEDPEAQKLLEECRTRMPNQSVSDEEARHLVEFMRDNDMKRTGSKDGAVVGSE